MAHWRLICSKQVIKLCKLCRLSHLIILIEKELIEKWPTFCEHQMKSGVISNIIPCFITQRKYPRQRRHLISYRIYLSKEIRREMKMNLQIQTQSLSTHFPLPPFPPKPKFLQAKPKPSFKLCSSLSTVSAPPTKSSHKPFPAEVSRTIVELSCIGTLSTLAQDGWPLGVGVRFAVDAEGTPVLCLPQPSPDNRSTLHVQVNFFYIHTSLCKLLHRQCWNCFWIDIDIIYMFIFGDFYSYDLRSIS